MATRASWLARFSNRTDEAMCGIFGYVGDVARARAIDLEGAIRSLHHRGPDANGTFFDERGRIACAFAHTRLSIIDLSPAGRQPMSTEDGRYTINYNGEVFNYYEIRHLLTQSGYRFFSECDTEVVLKAYEAWGADCVHRFRGMFAFAIWDREEQVLFAARDRLGIKPFYYRYDGNHFAFASEIRALMNAGLAEQKLDFHAVDDYLQFGSVQDPRTILRDVQSLMPGTSLTYSNGLLQLRTYWEVPDVEARDEVDLGELRELLAEAVSLRLIADVPVGVFLSGGIDSSVITALASIASSRPVRTFTVTFGEQQFDEGKFAAHVASAFGCEHHEILLPPERIREEIDDVIDALDQPSVDGANSYFVSEAVAKSGLRVALSGLGGDEVFAGYSTFRRYGKLLQLSAAGSRVPLVLSKLLAGSDPMRQPARRRKLAAVLRAGGDPEHVYRILRAVFDDEQRDALLGRRAVKYRRRGGVSHPEDPVNDLSYRELTGYLRNTLLRDTDVMSMAHSLEVRVPLLDHELVEKAMGIPGRAKIEGDMNKPLLLAAVPELPREAYDRPKMGFTLPWEEWLRGPLRERVGSWLEGDCGIIERDAASRLWRSYLAHPGRITFSRIWTLAILTAWCERRKVESGV